MNPANKSPKRGALRLVTSVEAPDDATVIFHLSQPFLEMSSLSPDIIPVLARQPDLAVSDRTGANFSYLGFNLEDPVLSHREIRQALALATDREALIRYLLRGQAKLAGGALPPDHWAAEPNVAQYPYDAARAEQVLDAAGLPRKQDGIRAHLTLKCSTEEQARLIGAAFQEQWRRVGIQLELRRSSLPRCSPTWPREIFRSPTSAGLKPTPIRTF